jgi:hypothetical protein
MLEQKLKEIWKNSSQKEKIKFETSRLLIDLKSKMDHIEKAIHRRDRTEIAASIFGILLFGYFTYTIPFPVTKIASLLGAIWFCFVIYKFKNSQKKKLAEDLTLSFREQLKNEKAYMSQQARLLDTAACWYSIPPFIINILFVMGLGNPVKYGWSNIIVDKVLPLSPNIKIFILVGLAIFYGFTIWINKRAVKKNLKPVIKEIERIQHQLEIEY